MTLRERLNKIPEQVGCINVPTDKFIDGYLAIATAVIEAVYNDLKENEPTAHVTIGHLTEAIEFIPVDCEEVADIDDRP